MELSHLPYKKGVFEDYVGVRGLEKYGKRKWRRYVADVVAVSSPPSSPTRWFSEEATPKN
jgi:hypothetical protein